MKTVYNYAFRIVCIYMLTLGIFTITNIEITTNKSESKIVNANGSKKVESKVIMKKIEHNEEESPEEKNTESEAIEEPQTPVVESPKEEVQNTYQYVTPIDTASIPVLQRTSGSLSHYGHDCYGCTSGRTASGYDISRGNIYYTDPIFGSVRIVAAGYEYPEGTVMRLLNVEESPILAIVLDRGGAIGAGKKYTLDLLTENNAKAYQLGTKYDVQIEILRLGY